MIWTYITDVDCTEMCDHEHDMKGIQKRKSTVTKLNCYQKQDKYRKQRKKKGKCNLDN